MKEQLISFETAKLAKEKGFKTLGMFYYHSNSDKVNKGTWDDGELNWNGIPYDGMSVETWAAPTQSLLQKWLRELHNTHVTIMYFSANADLTPGDDYQPMIDIIRPVHRAILEDLGDFRTYEEALEKGLQEALKLINNNNGVQSVS